MAAAIDGISNATSILLLALLKCSRSQLSVDVLENESSPHTSKAKQSSGFNWMRCKIDFIFKNK